MCSVQEEDLSAPLQKEKMSPGRVCMKCRTEKAILMTRVNDAFCRACFMVYVTHKFRATIGKSKLIRDGERVLVAFSGGPSSTCLLRLIQEGLSERAHKKLRFKPGLIFIDEGCTPGQKEEEYLQAYNQVKQKMLDTGYTSYIYPLQQVFCSPTQKGDPPTESSNHEACNTTSENESTKTQESSSDKGDNVTVIEQTSKATEQLKMLLSNVKSLTAKEDIIHKLRQMVLTDVARQHGYTKVMTGHCATRLAVILLSNISQGRGSQVGIETTFSDKRYEDITFVKPIREFSSKEVALYNSLSNEESVFLPTLTTKMDAGSSIEHLTESFVTGLQSDYLSTVSNIMRTGEKLTTEIMNRGDNQCCSLCKAPLDTDVGLSSALSAVEFSQKISQNQVKGHCQDNNECCGEGDGSCHTKSDSVSKEDVMSVLCYGCRLTVKDVSDIGTLPEGMLKDVSFRIRRSKMKADISDFLLDPSTS